MIIMMITLLIHRQVINSENKNPTKVIHSSIVCLYAFIFLVGLINLQDVVVGALE